MKKTAAMLLALCMTLLCACALGEITVSKKDMALNRALDKNVNNVLMIMQDGEKSDTIMIASINGKTGRSVMTRVDGSLMVDVPEVGSVALEDVYVLGAPKSRGFLMARTLNTLLDLNISTYMALDIERLPEIVEVVGTLNMQYDEYEAAATGTWTGLVELTGEDVLSYVRMKLPTDSPARSRGYDALMQLLYQGLNGGNLGDMMSLGSRLLGSMDTNLNVLSAVTMVSAVQGGSDRRELLISDTVQGSREEMRAAFHREVYE